MAIAIADEHVQLVAVASSFMKRHGDRASARVALEADAEELPEFWDDLRELGWLGLHLPEEYGGSGFGLEELAVVVEELGRADRRRARSCPASSRVPSSPAAGSHGAEAARCCPGWPTVRCSRGIALDSELEVRGGAVQGSVEAVVGGGLAGIFVLPAGDDVVIVDASAAGVETVPLPNLDPSRRSVQLTLDGAPAEVLPGAGRLLLDVARMLFAAEAVGMAQACVRDGQRVRPHPHPVRPASSPCSRRSSTTAPTWPSPPSSPPPPRGMPAARRSSAATSSPTLPPSPLRWRCTPPTSTPT